MLTKGQSGRGDSTYPPLLYTWHDKHYLGAAHGMAGILTLLLLVMVTIETYMYICTYTFQFYMSNSSLHPPPSLSFSLCLFQSEIKCSNSLRLIQESVDYLLSLQLSSKNFPSSLESAGGKDRLVQWCHGAPGYAHLWATAYRVN